MKKSKKQKSLTEWDWTTLVAAWRYFEYRMTIASAMFPAEIVERFFNGEYDNDSCKRIAHQFAKIDHFNGEKDWAKDKTIKDCDRKSWCKFYAYCKAYCDGFRRVTIANDCGLKDTVDAFFCEYTKRWYPRKEYEQRPHHEIFIPNEFIKEVKA